jgi:hypothetical protein
VGLYIVKEVNCRFERSRLDRRRAKSVAMRRYIEAAAWKVKERVDQEGSTREERDTEQRVVPWSGGCEHEEIRTEAQWNCGSQTMANTMC